MKKTQTKKSHATVPLNHFINLPVDNSQRSVQLHFSNVSSPSNAGNWYGNQENLLASVIHVEKGPSYWQLCTYTSAKNTKNIIEIKYRTRSGT